MCGSASKEKEIQWKHFVLVFFWGFFDERNKRLASIIEVSNAWLPVNFFAVAKILLVFCHMFVKQKVKLDNLPYICFGLFNKAIWFTTCWNTYLLNFFYRNHDCMPDNNVCLDIFYGPAESDQTFSNS